MRPIHIYLSILSLFAFLTAASAEEKTILNISAYHKGYKWTDNCVRGIESNIDDKYDLQTIYMNTKILPKDQHQKAADNAWNTYIETKPDMVMLGDDNALAYLGARLARTNVPVVFYGINANPRKYFTNKHIPPNITGILERVPIYSVIRIIKPLIKDAKKVLMLSDNSPTTHAIIETMLDGKERISVANISFYSKIIHTFQEWRKEIEQAHNKYDAIYLSTFFTIKDDNGNVMNHKDVLRWSSMHTKIPILGSQELMVTDDGALGAFVIVGEKHGQLAAEMASQILEQGKIPLYIMHQETRILFNQKQLKRFNITLPEGLKRISATN